MEKFSLLLMIAAVVFDLFSDKIDMAVKGNKKVKKVLVIFSVGILLVCRIAILVNILSQISKINFPFIEELNRAANTNIILIKKL